LRLHGDGERTREVLDILNNTEEEECPVPPRLNLLWRPCSDIVWIVRDRPVRVRRVVRLQKQHDNGSGTGEGGPSANCGGVQSQRAGGTLVGAEKQVRNVNEMLTMTGGVGEQRAAQSTFYANAPLASPGAQGHPVSFCWCQGAQT